MFVFASYLCMKFTVIFLLTITFFCNSIAQDNSFRQLWTFQTEESPVQPVSLGFGKIFIPFANGILQALDFETGKAIWKIEFGGEIVDSIKIDVANGNVLAVTTKLIDDKRIVTIRAIASETGITQWQRSEPINVDSSIHLLLSGNSNIIMTDNKIIASDNINGQVIYQGLLNVFNPKQSYFNGIYLFYFENLNSLVRLDLKSNKTSNIFQTSNKLSGNIDESSGKLYFSDNLGFIYSIDLITQKVVWKTRLGAEILDINSIDNASQILVTSKDIYFYQINKINGKKTRKFRLESSSFGEIASLKSLKDLVLVTLDNEVLIIDAKSATISNRIISKEPIIYSAIGFASQIIIVNTNAITVYK